MTLDPALTVTSDLQAPPRLTQREQQLANCLGSGLVPKEAANVMQVTHGTLRVYAARLSRKLGVSGIRGIASWELRRQINERDIAIWQLNGQIDELKRQLAEKTA